MNGLFFACLYGAGSVLLGAFVTHGLNDVWPAANIQTLQTAARYLFYTAMPLLVLSLTQKEWQWPRITYALFIISGALFSGSLVAYVVFQQPWLAAFTPIGGVLYVFAWISVGWWGHTNLSN